MDDTAVQIPFSSLGQNLSSVGGTTHHILAGSFRSVSLFLLAFHVPPSPTPSINTTSISAPSLTLVQTVPGFGPHQYLARNVAGDRVYTTSWAEPPVLSAWKVDRGSLGDEWGVSHLGNAPIAAISSYIALSPPSSCNETLVYSTGGPSGELHSLSPSGALSTKLQEFTFNNVSLSDLHSPSSGIDKSRKALRVGSHGIEFAIPPAPDEDKPVLAFVPHLTPSEIYVFTVDSSTGKLTLVSKSGSPPRVVNGVKDEWENDGPRHVKVHPNGKVLYCVTEHSNYLDIYTISHSPTPTLAPKLEYHSSRSIIPLDRRGPKFSSPDAKEDKTHEYRGDTLLLSPSLSHSPPTTIFCTTRGATTATRGYVSAFKLDADGFFSSSQDEKDGEMYYETPTSGGRAHALDILPQSSSASSDNEEERLWILLTDDDDTVTSKGGGVRVLEWTGYKSGEGMREVVGWPMPGGETRDGEEEERLEGGSHAVWLD